MLHNILLGVNSYCGKYEIFDLEMTLTLVFDLEMTLTLMKTSQHGVIAYLAIMNNLRYLTLK